jgi:hypothetical protein
MWLEPTQFTGTGTSTVWADLSGNGYNMSYSSSYTSPPVLTTTSPINGNNYVTFTGTGACRITGSINFPQNERSIFIAARPRGVINQASTAISMFGPTSVFGTLSMSLGGNSGGGATWYMTNTGNYQSLQITTTGSIPSQSNGFIMAAVNANATASNVWTINGTSYTLQANNAASYSSVGSAYTQYIGGGGTSPTGDWDCFEIIFYSYAVSPRERQQIEGYLAWKWGLEVIPQATIVPGVPPLSVLAGIPTDIPGCALWLDAADTQTLGLSNPNTSPYLPLVTQWNDKSGNGYNATLSTGCNATAPTYNQTTKGIQFVAGNTNVGSTSAGNSLTIAQGFGNALVSKTCSFFFVAQRSIGTGGAYAYFLSGQTAGTNQNLFVGINNSDAMEINEYGASLGSTITAYSAPDPIRIYGYAMNSTNYTTVSNGTVLNTGVSGSYSLLTSFTQPEIGRRYGNTGNNVYHTFNLFEMIVFAPALSTTQRQQVEGYLGKKWGITVPSSPAFTGLSLWLDASDTTTLFQDTAGTTPVTADGQSVACWKDKSGNAYSFTQATSGNRPTFRTAALNGGNILRWNGTSQYLQSSTTLPFFASPSSGGTFFFVFNASQIATQRCLLHYQNSVSTGYCTDETDIAYTTGAQAQGNFGFHRGCGYAAVALKQVNQLQANENLLMTGVLGTTGSTPANVQIFKNGRSSTVQNDSSGYYSAGSYPSANNSRYMIIGSRYLYGTTPDCYHQGDIAEVIWFNTVLTSVQRQQIESYLSLKWGIAMYNNGYTPLLQSPTTIPYCKVWFDGSDPAGTGAKPEDGASITTWVDKSGNGYNATVASGKTAATFSAASNCVYFQASNVGYATSYPANPTNETMFVVFNNPNPSSANNIIIGGQLGARSLGAGYSLTGGVNVVGNLNNEVAWLAATPTNSYPSGTTTLVTSQFTSTSNGVALNGKAYSTGGSPAFSNSTTTYLGVDTTISTYYYIGYAMEIIFYSNTLNVTQRQAVERYLSLKWNIPNFYTSIPGSVSGLQLWLDGADSSTMTFPSGSNVSGLQDKASLGLVLSNYLSGYYPTFVTGLGLNFSNPSSTCNSTNQCLTNTTTWYVPTQNMTLLVAYKPTSTDTYRQPVAVGGGTSGINALPNFYMSPQCGANEADAMDYDYSFSIGNWQMNAYASINTYNGLRIDSLVSVPGATSGFFFVNGTETSYSSTIAPYTSTYTNYPARVDLAMGPIIGNRPFNGYIQEVLFYSNALTSTERRVAESYLAKKWGNTSVPTEVLPITHPFALIKPLSRQFTPLDVEGCIVWLDASDASSFGFSSGSNISFWADKSGLSNNITNVTATPPTYSSNSNAVVFTAANSTGMYGTLNAQYSSNASVFVVGSYTSNSGGGVSYPRIVPLGLSNNANYVGQLNVIVQSSVPYLATYSSIGGNPTGVGTNLVTAIPTTYSTVFVYTNVSSMSGSSLTITTFLNGNTSTYSSGSGTPTLNPTYYTTSYARIGIGNYLTIDAGSGDCFNGNIYEVVVYSNALTEGQRRRVEGYLTWKWNKNSSLPATHPFYKFPSSSAVPFLPTNITNCSLWLDASAPNAFNTFSFSSGSNVKVWYDKSGSNNHATATAGAYPTYSYTSNCVVWNGTSSSQLVLDPNISNSVVGKAFTIFVVSQRTVGSENFFMRGTNTANNSNLLIGHGGSTPTKVIRFAYYGNDLDSSNIPVYTANEPASIICFQYSKPNRAIYYNGSLGSSDTNSTDLASWTGAMVGGGGGTWLAYQGKIFEIIIYSAILSTQQRQQVEGYLGWKWGLASSLNSFTRSGLVYYLDAGNTASYSGSGSTWTDLVGTGVATTLYNSPTFSSASGGYISFTPSSSQYAATSAEFQSGVYTNWSVEVWVAPTNTYTGTNPAIVTQKYPSTINYILGAAGSVSGSNIAAGFFNGTWYQSAGYSPTANAWIHIVGTYDSSYLRVYVNGGVNIATATTATPTWANDGGINLMRRWDSADYFGGKLAIVRIYSTALSSGQINANFNAERGRFGI